MPETRLGMRNSGSNNTVLHVIGGLGLAAALAMACGWMGHSQSLGGSNGPGQNSGSVNPYASPPGLIPTPFGDLDPVTAERRMRALNIQRQKQMISDSDKLLKLAKELNAEVSASNEGFLTVEQLRQLVQIEKLARNVREEMIDTVNQPTTILPHPPLMPPYR